MWRDDPSDGNVYDVAPAQAQPKANKKKKRQSKKKEPNAPKRAMSAYIFFTFAIREQTKRENPDISVTELNKMMGAKWRMMTDEQKMPYVAQAELDKSRYAQEKKAADMAELQRQRAIFQHQYQTQPQFSAPGPPQQFQQSPYPGQMYQQHPSVYQAYQPQPGDNLNAYYTQPVCCRGFQGCPQTSGTRTTTVDGKPKQTGRKQHSKACTDWWKSLDDAGRDWWTKKVALEAQQRKAAAGRGSKSSRGIPPSPRSLAPPPPRSGKRKRGRNQTSQYTGVCFDTQSKKWKAQISVNGKKKHLGYYVTEAEAGAAFVRARSNDKAQYGRQPQQRYSSEMNYYMGSPEYGAAAGAGLKKKRGKKDPNAPKRPLTAFMFYSTQRRPQLKEQNPHWKFGEFGKAIGAEWAQMNDKQKMQYAKQAAQDTARYQAELAVYNS